MSELYVPNGQGGYAKTPSIFIRKFESNMRDVSERLRRKVGDVKYQTLVGGLKEALRRQMKKDDTGPFETAKWFIEAWTRKKKLTILKKAAMLSAAYELTVEKA